MKPPMYILYGIPIMLIYIFNFACSPPQSQTLKNPIFISYTDESFSSTNIDDIEIYRNRGEIPFRYTQIGIIKFDKEHDRNILILMAADKGAHAIIFESDNVVMLRFIKKEDGDENIPIETLRYYYTFERNIC